MRSAERSRTWIGAVLGSWIGRLYLRWLRMAQSFNRLGKAPRFVSQISNLKYEISNTKSQISNLKSQIRNLKSQISNLKFQISSFKSQISNLKFQISSFKSQVSNLKYEISNFKSQIEQSPSPGHAVKRTTANRVQSTRLVFYHRGGSSLL